MVRPTATTEDVWTRRGTCARTHASMMLAVPVTLAAYMAGLTSRTDSHGGRAMEHHVHVGERAGERGGVVEVGVAPVDGEVREMLHLAASSARCNDSVAFRAQNSGEVSAEKARCSGECNA